MRSTQTGAIEGLPDEGIIGLAHNSVSLTLGDGSRRSHTNGNGRPPARHVKKPLRRFKHRANHALPNPDISLAPEIWPRFVDNAEASSMLDTRVVTRTEAGEIPARSRHCDRLACIIVEP